MNSLLLFGLLGWLYLVSILKRAHLTAFYFIAGSVGSFFILIALADPYWVWFMTHAVINVVKLLGETFGWCHVMTKYGIVYITNANNPVMMTIDYECSGIIESTAFLALVMFYPIYDRAAKVFYGWFGLIWIYLANVLRLLIVIGLVHFGGAGWYYWAHSFIGRLVFYALVIILYYNVFTYSQLSKSLYVQVIKRWRAIVISSRHLWKRGS